MNSQASSSTINRHYQPSADGQATRSGLSAELYERKQVEAAHRRMLGHKAGGHTRSISEFLKKRR